MSIAYQCELDLVQKVQLIIKQFGQYSLLLGHNSLVTVCPNKGLFNKNNTSEFALH